MQTEGDTQELTKALTDEDIAKAWFTRATDTAAGAVPEEFLTEPGVPIVDMTPKGTMSKAPGLSSKEPPPLSKRNHHQGRQVWYLLPQHHHLLLQLLKMMTHRQHPHPPPKEVAPNIQNS